MQTKSINTIFSQIPEIVFSEYDLSNGLHVILQEDHKTPIVCINITYHVGSKNETPQRAGFAHLFEHLLFEGSKNVPRGMFDEYITRAGGNNNAYTTEDKTNYYMVLPSHELELGLWLESDRMLECVVTEESLRNQKDVVMEEKRERYDNSPYGSLSERMNRLAYNSFSYKWTVIGDMKSIEAATLNDVRSFFETFYVPNNAVLTITGDIQVQQTKELVEKYFGSIKRGTEIVRPIFDEAEQFSERRVNVKTEDVPLPGIFWSYRIPPDGTREALAFDILTDILATGQSSRLFRELVYTRKCASEVSAYIDSREMPGLVWFYAIGNAPTDSNTALEEALASVLNTVATEGVTDTELTKAKNKAEMRTVAGRARISTKADHLAHCSMFYNDTNKINTTLDELRGIDAQLIQDIAKKYLDPTKRCAVTYEPPKSVYII